MGEFIAPTDERLLELTAPNVRVAMPLLADENGHRMIRLEQQFSPLSVHLETAWPGYDQDYQAGRTMTLQLRGRAWPSTGPFTVLHTRASLPMPPPGNWVALELVVPGERLATPGIYELDYTVAFDDIGNAQLSDSITINIDRTPPEAWKAGEALRLDEPTTLIDAQYLERHGGQLVGSRSEWLDLKLEDVMELYLESVNPPAMPLTPVGRVLVEQVKGSQPRVVFSLGAQILRESGDGLRYLSYRLVDRAGNANPLMSEPISFELKLADQPPVVDYRPATCPDATIWGHINCSKVGNALKNGLRLFIPGAAEAGDPVDIRYLQEGDLVSVGWQVFRGPNGRGEALTPRIALDEQRVGRPEVDAGLTVVMDQFLERAVLPLYLAYRADRQPMDGSAVIDYRVRRASDAGTGYSEASDLFLSFAVPGDGPEPGYGNYCAELQKVIKQT